MSEIHIEDTHKSALNKLQFSRIEMEERLHESDMEQMAALSIVSLIAKLALVNGHDLNKVMSDVTRIDKSLGRVLAMQIKDSYNSWGWLACAVAGVGINAAGLSGTAFVALGKKDAQIAQSLLQFTQLLSTLTQPGTTYYQNRDEAARSMMQTKQRSVDSNRSEESQKTSQRDQKLDQLLQVLERVCQQDSQAKERAAGG